MLKMSLWLITNVSHYCAYIGEVLNATPRKQLKREGCQRAFSSRGMRRKTRMSKVGDRPPVRVSSAFWDRYNRQSIERKLSLLWNLRSSIQQTGRNFVFAPWGVGEVDFRVSGWNLPSSLFYSTRTSQNEVNTLTNVCMCTVRKRE